MTDRSLFAADNYALLIDRKDRRYLLQLAVDGEFHSHAGIVSHNDIIGEAEGAPVKADRGARYIAVRPTLSDYILKMPRGAQVIYPKDLGPILMLADIAPGVRVLESGIGSGALSMTMLRAGARIIGYELRDDFARKAQRNVANFLGDVGDRYKVEIRSAYDGIDEVDLDRVVLDLPEPWQVVPHAAKALIPGGIFVAYTPSITQAVQLREALDEHGFALPQTLEVLNRGWHIKDAAVRPDHRMVAHTAFLTQARYIGLREPIATPGEVDPAE